MQHVKVVDHNFPTKSTWCRMTNPDDYKHILTFKLKLSENIHIL